MKNGVIRVVSKNDFDKTYDKVKGALENNPNIFIVREIDHQKNAKNVGLSLDKLKAIFFGNPNMGSPLMQSNVTVALDLPQKVLVTETEGIVHIVYNDPFYLKERHDLKGVDETLEKIKNALNKLTTNAASE